MTTAEQEEEKRFWQSLAGIPGAETHLIREIEDRLKGVESDILTGCSPEQLGECRARRTVLLDIKNTLLLRIKTSHLHSIHAS